MRVKLWINQKKAVIFFFIGLFYSLPQVLSNSVIIINKGRINIAEGTFFIIVGSLKTKVPIRGEGYFVLSTNSKTNQMIQPETAISFLADKPIFPAHTHTISGSNGVYVQNLVLREGTFMLYAPLFVSSLHVANHAKLLLNWSCMVANLVSGCGEIVENGVGKIFLLTSPLSIKNSNAGNISINSFNNGLLLRLIFDSNFLKNCKVKFSYKHKIASKQLDVPFPPPKHKLQKVC